MFKVSIPTKKQVVHSAELVAVAFGAAFVRSLVASKAPWTHDAIVGAAAAGLASIYALVKAFTTTL